MCGPSFCFAANVLLCRRKLGAQQWHVALSEVTQVVLKLDFQSISVLENWFKIILKNVYGGNLQKRQLVIYENDKTWCNCLNCLCIR